MCTTFSCAGLLDSWALGCRPLQHSARSSRTNTTRTRHTITQWTRTHIVSSDGRGPHTPYPTKATTIYSPPTVPRLIFHGTHKHAQTPDAYQERYSQAQHNSHSSIRQRTLVPRRGHYRHKNIHLLQLIRKIRPAEVAPHPQSLANPTHTWAMDGSPRPSYPTTRRN